MQTDKLQVLFELGRYSEIIRLCRETPSYIEDARAVWYCAASFVHSKQFEEAIKEAREGVTRYPESSAFYLILAAVYGHIGLYNEAEKACRKALACDPHLTQCHLMAAHIYIAADRYAKALEHLQLLFEIEPDHSEAYLLLANVYYYTDKEKQAREAVTKALEIAPDNADALAFLATLSRKRVEKTSLLKKALLIEPSEKEFQKRYREETGDRYRAMFFAVLFSAGLVAYRYFSPPAIQEAGLPVFRFLIVSVLIYYSIYYYFTFFLSLTVALSVAFLDGDLFQAGFSADTALKNFSELAGYVIVAILAVLVASIVRVFLMIPVGWIQDKWGQYKKQRKAGQGTITSGSIVRRPLTWYYVTGAFFIPSASCIGHYISTQVFWLIVMASFVCIAAALFFLAEIHKIGAVFKATLLYGICVLILTIFCSAMVDGRDYLVIPVVFLAAVAGTVVAYNYGANKRESILLKQKSRENHSNVS